MEIKVTEELNKKFDAKYEVVSESGCWIWTGALATHPTHKYGNLPVSKSFNYKAHRYSAARFLGAKLTSKDFVCHKCDVAECVNPDHLYIGNAATNAADRERRNRNTYQRGEDHPMRKICADTAKKIFLEAGNHGEIAKRYGVTRPTVSAIKAGRLWRHVTESLGDYTRPKRNKLTPQMVVEIFKSKGSHSAIAEKYGVSRSNVTLIKNGTNWSHITQNLRNSADA